VLVFAEYLRGRERSYTYTNTGGFPLDIGTLDIGRHQELVCAEYLHVVGVEEEQLPVQRLHACVCVCERERE
jgi:hypothetical protein